MKNFNLTIRIIPTRFAKQVILLMFLFGNYIFPQVVIKERIEINPGVHLDGSSHTGCNFGNCSYDLCDSTELELRFTPESVEPGGTTIMKLWIGEFEYDEDAQDIIQRIVTVEPPEYGEIIKIGSGEYFFTASDTITVDSVLVTINYENYSVFCWGRPANDTTKINRILDCPDCFPYGSGLMHHYGSEQIVIDWDSLDVKVVPDTIYPGGTVQVVIKKRLPDGSLTDFPPEQTYEIAKLEGCLSGNIVVGQDSGAYFYDVSQPIYFAVADSLVGDSVGTVLLQVGLVIESEKPGLENKPNNIESNECFTGNFQSESKDNTNVIINDFVSIDWNTVTYHINSAPEMPDNLSIWIRPNFFSGTYFLDWYLEVKWVSTEQEPDKTFSYTFNDQTIGYSADGVGLTLPETDETIVGGDELKLTIRYTDNNFNDEEVTKKLTVMKILGENPNKQIIKDYIYNHEYPVIGLPLSEAVTEADQKLQMQILVFKESTWRQFKNTGNTVGYPSMNPNPNDWGLCQLSIPEPSLGIIWDWKANINAGIHHLWGTDPQFHKYAQIKNKFSELKELFTEDSKVPRDPSREEFLKMLSQRYKGGYYYESYKHGNAKGEKGFYTPSATVSYGNDFWTKFKDVENGPPYPSGW